MSALLPAAQGGHLSRQTAHDARPRVPLHAEADAAIRDGLHAQVRDVLLATAMLDEDVEGEVKV